MRFRRNAHENNIHNSGKSSGRRLPVLACMVDHQEKEKVEMKKILLFILIAGLLTGSAAAASVPDDVVIENRNGRQLIVKTYTLLPGDNPDALLEEPFEKEGFSYVFDSIVKQETPYELKKAYSETVTVETDTDDLAAILETLAPTIPYDDGEYTGTLALDHKSLQTEATGYSTKYYTVSETKTIEGLDRNDPGYVPKTTVKNGRTLDLASVEWAVQGTGLADDTLVATQYMAVATYSAGASYKSVNGYITTAEYSGEIVSEGITHITYTVTYYGEPIPAPEPEPESAPEPESEPKSFAIYFIIGGAALAAVIAAAVLWLLKRPNVRIYACSDDGFEYELIGRQRITANKPGIDLRVVTRYPEEEAMMIMKEGTIIWLGSL